MVEPDETELLSVVEGEDLVTLLTCTPYGVNTQRLLGAGAPGAVRAGRGGGGGVGFPLWEQPPYQLHFLGRCGAGADGAFIGGWCSATGTYRSIRNA